MIKIASGAEIQHRKNILRFRKIGLASKQHLANSVPRMCCATLYDVGKSVFIAVLYVF
jgi:hypothetical protein